MCVYLCVYLCVCVWVCVCVRHSQSPLPLLSPPVDPHSYHCSPRLTSPHLPPPPSHHLQSTYQQEQEAKKADDGDKEGEDDEEAMPGIPPGGVSVKILNILKY